MTEYMSEISLLDLIGVLGVAFYVGNYLSVSLGRSSSHSVGFFIRSGLGAVCMLTSLCEDFNLASAIIQVLFIAISLFGIATRLRQSKRSATLSRVANLATATP